MTRLAPVAIGWTMAVTMLVSLVFSLHTHLYDDVFLVLAAVTTLTPAVNQSGVSLPTKTAWRTLLLAFPYVSWIMVTTSLPESVKRVPFLVCNLLLLALAIANLRQHQQMGDGLDRRAQNSSQ